MKTIQQTIDDTLIKFKDVIEKKGEVKKIEYKNQTLGCIYYDNNNTIVGIECEDIFLIYHNLTILKNPENYFFKQTLEHGAYDTLINRVLTDMFDATEEAYKIKDWMKRKSEYYPPELFKDDWIHRINRKKLRQEQENLLETTLVFNNIMSEAINDRKEYLEKEILPIYKNFSNKIYTEAKKMIKLQYNIVNTHNRMVLESGKQLNVLQEYIMKI